MGLTWSTPHGTYCGSCPVRGCGYIGVGKRRAYPARTPLRPTVYPAPVWGTAGVPGYDAGPFVRSGYKCTARTTELHPDGECKHRPPQGETPGEGTRAGVRQPPPPPNATTPHTHQNRGSPEASTKGATAKATEQERGEGDARWGARERNGVVQSVVQHRTSGTRDGPPRVHPFARVHSSRSLR